MAVVVLLVLGAGLTAAGLYSGVIPAPGDAAALPTCAPAAKPAAVLTTRQVQIDVYNGSGRSGLAASTAAALRAQRFTVAKIANAPGGARVTSAAIVRYGPRGKARALLLGSYVPGARLIQDERTTTLLDLVLGSGFTTVRKPAVATPKPTATSTTSTISAPTVTPSCTPAPATPSGTTRSRPTTTPR